jgi:hypothetical protein
VRKNWVACPPVYSCLLTCACVDLVLLQRKKLPTVGLTPVTAATFAKWKEDRSARKARDVELKRSDEAKKTGGKGLGVLSGRALFTYDPSLFIDDGDAAAAEDYDEAAADDDAADDGGAGPRGGAGGPADVTASGMAEDLYAGDDGDLAGLADDDEDEGGDEEEEEVAASAADAAAHA